MIHILHVGVSMTTKVSDRTYDLEYMTLNSKVNVKYNVAFNTNVSFEGDSYFTHCCVDDNEGFGLLI